jgi:Fe-S oxidoreductase
MLKSPMAVASTVPLTAVLPACSENEALIVMPESGVVNSTVFYFPGCGSERLFSDIAMAAIYLLAKNNIRTVLPPPYLCCGFPAKVNAKKKMAGEISLRDTIILTQIKEMLGHFVFDSFLISCGTCRESLHEIGCEEIFECGMDDISHYILEKTDWKYGPKQNVQALYHTPCHDSFEGQGAALLKRFYNSVESIPNCCSEAGTLAISRPDISYAMLERKRESIAEKIIPGKKMLMATNCPSCLSGLGRNSDLNIEPKHMAVLLAETLGGKYWKDEFSSLVARSEKVTF